MATATRPNIERSKKLPRLSRAALKAKKTLLDDLVEDAKRCVENKSEPEKRDFFREIKKIARG
jgi:hypothetical protein